METKVTCVIPVYNEEKTIKEIVNSVKPYCDDILVVLARKSSDQTKNILDKIKVRYIVDNGKGKGDAIRCAISAIHGGILVFFDADGSHIAKDIKEVVRPIKSGLADMVIASRFIGGSMELHGDFSKFMRVFLAMCIAQIINWRFHTTIGDTQNGFRAIKASVAKQLHLKANIFDIETEMVMKCYKKGYRVLEVPSRELARKYGKSGIKIWKMGSIYMWRVLKNLF